jgi:hypothetical protein
MADSHWYTLITFETANMQPEFGTLWSNSPYLIIERYLLQRSIPGDTRIYVNGSKVYRIHSSHVHLLPLDRIGRRFIPSKDRIYYWQEDDPAANLQPKQEVWMPVGP